jgi:hypothetical protein
MKIKTAPRFHLSLVRLAIVKKTKRINTGEDVGRKEL